MTIHGNSVLGHSGHFYFWSPVLLFVFSKTILSALLNAENRSLMEQAEPEMQTSKFRTRPIRCLRNAPQRFRPMKREHEIYVCVATLI